MRPELDSVWFGVALDGTEGSRSRSRMPTLRDDSAKVTQLRALSPSIYALAVTDGAAE